MTDSLTRLRQSLEDGDDQAVDALTAELLSAGGDAAAILDALLAGMAAVGERFRCHDIFLPDVLLSARAMHASMARLRPVLVRAGIGARGKVVIGTVNGDLHDIGKNLVSIMLQADGVEVLDLGTNVSAARFVDAAVEAGAPVIAMSALLTTTMMHMKTVVDELERRGLRDRVRTIVGGAPVTEAFAREIGADAYAFDASSAAARVRELLNAGSSA
jgi:methanogenic corrinoid protein MtbC1